MFLKICDTAELNFPKVVYSVQSDNSQKNFKLENFEILKFTKMKTFWKFLGLGVA